MRIGVLTGGGDAPGLNAVIRGLVVRATQLGHEVLGIRRGWKGMLERDARPLTLADVDGIQSEGGTVLKTSRTNPIKDDATRTAAVEAYRALRLDALVAVGGDDTLGACAQLARDGVKAVGVPKTIDNDLLGTDVTFGFDTAANIAAEALDRLHTTAASHERCLVVEIMGRHAGWITWAAGVAAGAHVILLPEDPFDMAQVAEVVRQRDREGKGYTLVAVAEGATPKDAKSLAIKSLQRDEFGNVMLGGIAEQLAKRLGELTGKEARHVVLGHLQRGGMPTASDRLLGTRLGVAAAELVHEKRFGLMLAVRGPKIVPVPLSEVEGGYRTVPPEERRLVDVFRGR